MNGILGFFYNVFYYLQCSFTFKAGCYTNFEFQQVVQKLGRPEDLSPSVYWQHVVLYFMSIKILPAFAVDKDWKEREIWMDF